jgi:uncharacterized protein
MHAIHVTFLFAGLLALMQCALTVLVIARRVKAKVSLLDGGDAKLTHRLRAHGNFTETVPICLIMMAMLELHGLPSIWLWAMGICLTLGRVLHATSLITKKLTWGRYVGMVLTITAISGLGVFSLVVAMGSLK